MASLLIAKHESNKGREIKQSLSLGFTAKKRRNKNSKASFSAAAKERSQLINAGKYNMKEEKRICEKYCLHQFL